MTPEERQAAEDASVLFYQGEDLDIGPAVRDELMIDLPPNPLCSEDCKGLCANCGINLDKETCDCETDAPDPTGPFAALNNLKS